MSIHAVPAGFLAEKPAIGPLVDAQMLSGGQSPPVRAPDADWLARLNVAQRAAVTFGKARSGSGVAAPPLLVIAGAGTGKTATLAHRVAWLVLNGVDPSRVLLLTFSRRAAQEMIRRAERLVAEAARAATGRSVPAGATIRLSWAGTFHAVGARLLREHALQVGLDPAFGILDRSDAADLIDVIRHDQGLSAKARRFPRKETCLAIYSYRVNTGLAAGTGAAGSLPVVRRLGRGPATAVQGLRRAQAVAQRAGL